MAPEGDGDGRRKRKTSRQPREAQRAPRRSRSVHRKDGPVSQARGPEATTGHAGHRVTIQIDNEVIQIQLPRLMLSMVELKLTEKNAENTLLSLDVKTLPIGISYHELVDQTASQDCHDQQRVDQKRAINDIDLPRETDDYILYYPVSGCWMKACCTLFGIPLQHSHEWQKPRIISRYAVPTRKSTTGDGNCMYRSISSIITGDQRYHRVVREKLVSFMMTHGDHLKGILEDGYQSVEEYVRGERVAHDGIWGCSVELKALATLTNTAVQVYTKWGWLNAFRPLFVPKLKEEYKMDKSNVAEGEVIYLSLLDGHYESIASV